MRYTSEPSARLGVIELFAGAAGLAQGFLRSGRYEILALFDILEAAKQSYQKRYPDVVYECCDVLGLEEGDIQRAVSGRRIYGVLGGPPCQGFSLAGSKNPKHDKNSLVGSYVHLVKQLHPDFLLMENVPQLLYHEQFANLQSELERDYYLAHTILNAAQYGAPQTRHRLFVLAYRKDLGVIPTWPKPTHGQVGQFIYSYRSKQLLQLSQGSSNEILGTDPVTARVLKQQHNVASAYLTADLHPLVTVQDAISDLYPLRERADRMPYPNPPQTPYQCFLRSGLTEVTNHIAREHAGKPLQIVRAMPEGGDLEDIDHSLWPKKHYSQAYGRLHRLGLARTLTTFFQNAGSGRFYHYEEERTLTVREAARLQGFDDQFEFSGALGEQMQLVGNAVPLPLAEALGRHIYRQIGVLLHNQESLKANVSEFVPSLAI
jgi:DNA (cytosine-5)-methyltransferase 1